MTGGDAPGSSRPSHPPWQLRPYRRRGGINIPPPSRGSWFQRRRRGSSPPSFRSRGGRSSARPFRPSAHGPASSISGPPPSTTSLASGASLQSGPPYPSMFTRHPPPHTQSQSHSHSHHHTPPLPSIRPRSPSPTRRDIRDNHRTDVDPIPYRSEYPSYRHAVPKPHDSQFTSQPSSGASPQLPHISAQSSAHEFHHDGPSPLPPPSLPHPSDRPSSQPFRADPHYRSEPRDETPFHWLRNTAKIHKTKKRRFPPHAVASLRTASHLDSHLDAASRVEEASPVENKSASYPAVHHPHPSHLSASPAHPPPSVHTRPDFYSRTSKQVHRQHANPKLPRTPISRLLDKRDEVEPASAPRSAVPPQTDPSNATSRSPSDHEPTSRLASPAAATQKGNENRFISSLHRCPEPLDSNNSKPTYSRHSLLSASTDLASKPLSCSPPPRSRLSSDAPNATNEAETSPPPLHSASAPSKDCVPSPYHRPPPSGPPRGLSTALSSERHSYPDQLSTARAWHTEYGRGAHYRSSKGRETTRHSHSRSARHWRSFPDSGLVSNLNDDTRSVGLQNGQEDSRLGRARGFIIDKSVDSGPGTVVTPSKFYEMSKDDKSLNDPESIFKNISHGLDGGAAFVNAQQNEIVGNHNNSAANAEQNRGLSQSNSESRVLDKLVESRGPGQLDHCDADYDRRPESDTKEKQINGTGTGLRSVAIDTVRASKGKREKCLISVATITTSSPHKGSGVTTSPSEGCTYNISESRGHDDTPLSNGCTELGCYTGRLVSNNSQMTRAVEICPERSAPRKEGDEGVAISTTNAPRVENESKGLLANVGTLNRESVTTDRADVDLPSVSRKSSQKVAEVTVGNSSSPTFLAQNASRVAVTNEHKLCRKKRNLFHESGTNRKGNELPDAKRIKTEVLLENAPPSLNGRSKQAECLEKKRSPSSPGKSPKKRMRSSMDGTDLDNPLLNSDGSGKAPQEAIKSVSMTQRALKAKTETEPPKMETKVKKENAIDMDLNVPNNPNDPGLLGNHVPNGKYRDENDKNNLSAKGRALPSSSYALSYSSRSLSAPIPMVVPTLSLLLASSPRGRSRVNGIEGPLGSFGRLSTSRTPPLLTRLGANAANTSDVEERENIFKEMREIDEKTKELEQKIASLKKKSTGTDSIPKTCNESLSIENKLESNRHGENITKCDSQAVLKLSEITPTCIMDSEQPKHRVMLPMHNNLRLILVQNQAKAAASNAALRGLCDNESTGLNTQPIQFKLPEPPSFEMTAKIAKEIARRRRAASDQKRRLSHEYGHLHSMWLHKLKVWKEKRSKEKRDASKERDRYLLLSTRGQSALLTSRTSSGRTSTKIVPSLSGNGFASGSTELDSMLADIEAEGGTPGSKETWSRTLAVIPDRDAEMRNFDCLSVPVDDPLRSLALSRCVNPWALHEIVIFLERLTMFPKNFRKIASFLGNKSTQECARFYFDNKLDLGMKQLVKEAPTLKRKGLLRSHIVDIAKKRPSSDSNIVVTVKNGEVIRTSARKAVEMYVNDKEVQLVDDARGVEEVEYRKEMMEERRETVGYAMKLSERIRLEWCGVDLSGIEHGHFMSAFRKCGTDWKALCTMLGADRVSSVQVRQYYRMHWRRIEAEVITKLVAAKRGKSEKSIGKTTAVASPRMVSKKTMLKSMDKTPLSTPKLGSSGISSAALSNSSTVKAGASVFIPGTESSASRRPRPGKIPSLEGVTVETGKSSKCEGRRNNGRTGQDVRREVAGGDKSELMKKSWHKGGGKPGDKADNGCIKDEILGRAIWPDDSIGRK